MSNSLRPHRRQPTRLSRPWDSPGKNTGVGCHCLLQCMKVKSESEVAESCPTPSDRMDCSLPSSSIHGIFQAGVLEWGAIAFSNSCLGPTLYVSKAWVTLKLFFLRNYDICWVLVMWITSQDEWEIIRPFSFRYWAGSLAETVGTDVLITVLAWRRYKKGVNRKLQDPCRHLADCFYFHYIL